MDNQTKVSYDLSAKKIEAMKNAEMQPTPGPMAQPMAKPSPDPEVPQTPAPPTLVKPSKPKTKVRTLEELDNASIKSMSDVEKTKYIEYLREEYLNLYKKCNELDTIAQGAFQAKRILEEQLQDTIIKAKAKLNYATQCIAHAHTSIILSGNMED